MALADACIHAARSSNSLLTQLWIDGGMAIFGYFDSHYLFSSTIILMMSSILGTNNSDSDREAADTASDIMEALVKDGNLPAAGFYQHFLEIRKVLTEFTERGNGGGGHNQPGQTIDQNSGTEVRLETADAGGGGQINDTNSAFLIQSALDDPSIQNFLTQPDIQYGLPFGMEMAGDMPLTAAWLFE